MKLQKSDGKGDGKEVTVHDVIARIARAVSNKTGHPFTFLTAVLLIAAWAISGPFFHFNNTWQLVINTCTTIATFLMVFLIQNTQNRDSAAVQLKLNEIIRALDTAENEVICLEEKTQAELDEIKEQYAQIARATNQIEQDINPQGVEQKVDAA